jgi:hypothetical protein
MMIIMFEKWKSSKGMCQLGSFEICLYIFNIIMTQENVSSEFSIRP